MKLHRPLLQLLLATTTAIISLSCDDAENEDTGSDGGDDNPGSVLVTGFWDGAQPDGVNFDVAVFPCPFTMPPEKASLNNPVDPNTGAVTGLVSEVPPGEWCVMAYIDMDPNDGLAPVKGTDALNATGQENDQGAIPIIVTSDKTTELALTFAIQPQ